MNLVTKCFVGSGCMKIISLNINDFGGPCEHLEEYKKRFRGSQGIQKWDSVDKQLNVEGIFSFLNEINPDIIIMQEFDINSSEAKYFNNLMESKEGYILKAEKTAYKRPSLTVFYVKDSLKCTYVSVGHTKNGRAYAIGVGEVMIYGTHIPPKYDKQFWLELHSFAKEYEDKKYVLIGDFNTINRKNMDELQKILNNSIDVWAKKGNNEKISLAGDYAIISKKWDIETVDIKINNDICNYTDHPAIILSLH